MTTDFERLGLQLAQCVRDKHRLETELARVNERATAIVDALHRAPDVRSPAPDETTRLHVPGYLTQPTECPQDCYVPFRHIHTADGAVHEVDLR